jgi:hypothetical protein
VKIKDLPDVSVEHKRPRSIIGASTTLTPVPLGPLRGCHLPGPHFASDCEVCKSIYGRYLKEREANIEARSKDQTVPMTPSPFIQRASNPA